MQQRQDWDGKTVLVTGACGGIGRAVADGFEELGASVVRADIQAPALSSSGKWIAVDVSDEESTRAMADAAMNETGQLDVIVNAAGIQVRKPAAEISLVEWQRLLSVNLTGMLLVTQAVLPALIESEGNIVNIGSLSAAIGVPGIVPYGATKGGVTQLTKGLAAELGDKGIRVNCVAPGYIMTNMTRQNLAQPDVRDRHIARTPLGRFGTPDDVSAAVLFLASSQAKFITGTVLPVDGGYCAT